MKIAFYIFDSSIFELQLGNVSFLLLPEAESEIREAAQC